MVCSITFILFLLVSLNHKIFLNWFFPPFKKKTGQLVIYCAPPWCTCGGQRTFFRNWFFLWVLEVKLKSLALVTCAKPCQSIYLLKKNWVCVCVLCTTSISHSRDTGCSSTMTYTASLILLFVVIPILRVRGENSFLFSHIIWFNYLSFVSEPSAVIVHQLSELSLTFFIVLLFSICSADKFS